MSTPKPHARWLVAIAIAIAACAPAEQPEETGPSASTPARTATTELGPIKATVELRPEAPRLGDPLTLTLLVEAEPDVTVEMPAFGEALGRFSILDFTPRQTTEPDGRTLASQTYRLQAPMSGKQRIPPLRVEFLDRRPGGGGDDDDATYKELLTEELAVEIASVLPKGAVVDDLRPPRAALAELREGFLARFGAWLILGVALVVALVWIAGILRRRARERARVTAYDRALRRLERLEQRGLPEAGDEDAWYVELSDIVRRYLEDRYGVRAPELTTEEFLREARHSAELSETHRELLSPFLEECDRVKFARYHPQQAESRQSLDLARRFLDETRIVRETQRSKMERSAA